MGGCIYQLPSLILHKKKHVVSDQTYNCPHNTANKTAFPSAHRCNFTAGRWFLQPGLFKSVSLRKYATFDIQGICSGRHAERPMLMEEIRLGMGEWENVLAEPWLRSHISDMQSTDARQNGFVQRNAQANDADVAETFDQTFTKASVARPRYHAVSKMNGFQSKRWIDMQSDLSTFF